MADFVVDEVLDDIRHGELLRWVSLETAAKSVGILFQRDAIVAPARKESPDVKLRESRNPKLAVLLNVDEFVEQEPFSKRHVRYHDITERDGGHLEEVRQVREAHASQYRVERRILDMEAT